MEYLQAFIAVGVISLLGQILFANTKLGPVRFFMVVISIGVLLAAFGAMNWLNAFGGGGIPILILGPGEITFGAMCALFAGNLSVIILLIVLLVCIFAAAIICGLTVKPGKKDGNAAGEDKE